METQDGAADVLLVDDEPRVAAALAFAIGHLGFRVRPAIDPAAVWAELDRKRPDLLLLDIDLGRSSGLSLLYELRQRAETSELPVLVLSALADPRIRSSAVSAGADDFIAKPFAPEELVARMRDHLRSR